MNIEQILEGGFGLVAAIVLVAAVIIGLMLFFAPLGCWSRLAKIDERLKYIHENGFEVRQSTEQMVKLFEQILAELKRDKEKPTS